VGGAVQLEHARVIRPAGGDVQQAVHLQLFKQERRRPAQGVVVGGMIHAEVIEPGLRVPQHRFGPTIAAFEQVLDHQAGEQLRQREVLAREAGGVGREGVASGRVSHLHHPPW
jgi:hypothetical protein